MKVEELVAIGSFILPQPETSVNFLLKKKSTQFSPVGVFSSFLNMYEHFSKKKNLFAAHGHKYH